MKPDIRTEEDVKRVVDAFYEGIAADVVLGPFFFHLDMELHMPRMYRFWSSAVLQKGSYFGNPYGKHASMHGLQPAHFERWLQRFNEAVDAHYEGPTALQMKQKASQIAQVFQSKLGMQEA